MRLSGVIDKLIRATPLIRPPAAAPAPAVPAIARDIYVPQTTVPPVPQSLGTPAGSRLVDADLQVHLDALPAGSQAELAGNLQGRLTVSGNAILRTLQEHLPSSSDVQFERVYYDAPHGEYRVEGQKIISQKLKFLNPSFTLRFKPDGAGRFRAEAESSADWLVKFLNGLLNTTPLSGHRLPTAQDTLQQRLNNLLDRNLFTLTRQNGRLVIDLVPKFTIPLGQSVLLELETYEGRRTAHFTANGDLVIDLQKGHFKGRIGQPNPGRPVPMEPDRADMRVRLAISQGTDSKLQAESLAEGTLQAHLTAEELQIIGQKLSPAIGRFASRADIELQNMKLHSRHGGGQGLQNRMEADLMLDVNRGEIRLAGHLRGDETDRDNWQVEAESVSVKTSAAAPAPPSRVAISKTAGRLKTEVTEPPAPSFKPRLSPNHLDLIVDGPNYAAALLKAINGAKESVTLESFGFEGQSQPQAIMRALLDRAAGLTWQGTVRKPDGSAGIQVKVLADRDLWYPILWPEEVERFLKNTRDPDWEARTRADLPAKRGPYAGISDDRAYHIRNAFDWARSFLQELQDGKGSYAGLTTAQRKQALDNLRRNIEVRQSGHHPVKGDHRKMVLIDGRHGFTGGMNMGDWNLVKAHDVMVHAYGPAVREMQEHFIRSWNESGPPMPDLERRRLLKSREALQASAGGSAPVAVLVTDDNRNEIEQAILRQIDTTKNTINIEHVFFAYAPVTERLVAAVRRGVNVNAVLPVPEETVGDFDGSKPFLFANLDSAMQLKAAANAPGAGQVNIFFYPRTLHTKAMTFDGRTTVVGSANLDQRGMHGAVQNFLFNRELSLLIADPAFTAEFDRRIMQADRQQARSWETVLQQLQTQYGGLGGLLREIEKRRGKERLY